jgi:hypothetical protein
MEKELAWLAGFIDGEGTIAIERSKSPSAKDGYLYSPSVSLYNTNSDSIKHAELIIKKVGVESKTLEDRRGDYVGASYHLRVRGQENVETFLKALLPFLVLKKSMAEVVLEFVSLRREQGSEYGS